MTKPMLLYTSAEIHTRIKRLFSQPSADDSRVALVAYVGTDGEKYLPHPAGLRVICNPSAGGTDPNTLRNLVRRGGRVQLSDNLHMKVYWSKNRGCVITSANASSNALGKGGLKEAGIWLPSGAVDIQRLIRYAQPRKLKKSDLLLLDKASGEHQKKVGNSNRKKSPAPEFLQWYSSPHRSAWKVAWGNQEVVGTAVAVKNESQAEYGHKEPVAWAPCRKDRVRKNDWLLSFTFAERGIKQIYWLYTDFLVRVSPKEKKYYSAGAPYHAVQVNPLSKYPLPPFQITPRFRKALSAAVKKYTADRIMNAKTDIPSVWFLRAIEREYRGTHQPTGRGRGYLE